MWKLGTATILALAVSSQAAVAQNIIDPSQAAVADFPQIIRPDTSGALALERAAGTIRSYGGQTAQSIQDMGAGIDGLIARRALRRAAIQAQARNNYAVHLIAENRCGDARQFALGTGDLTFAGQVFALCPAGPQSAQTAASAPMDTVRTRF